MSGKDQPINRPRHRHVQQASFGARILFRVRHVAKAGNRHQGKLEAFAGMHGEELDAVAIGPELPLLAILRPVAGDVGLFEAREEPLGDGLSALFGIVATGILSAPRS
jgi:hypothetical protein